MDFVNEFPKSEIADKAIFNASIDFFNGKMLDKAIETRKRIIKEYPKSQFVPQTIFALAEGYEAIADFDDAADYYEDYADEYEKSIGKGGKKGARAEGAAARRRARRRTKAPKRPRRASRSGKSRRRRSRSSTPASSATAWASTEGAEEPREVPGAVARREGRRGGVPLDRRPARAQRQVQARPPKQLEEYERKYHEGPEQGAHRRRAASQTHLRGEDEEPRQGARRSASASSTTTRSCRKKTQKALEITALDPVGRAQLPGNEDDYKKYLGVKLQVVEAAERRRAQGLDQGQEQGARGHHRSSTPRPSASSPPTPRSARCTRSAWRTTSSPIS